MDAAAHSQTKGVQGPPHVLVLAILCWMVPVSVALGVPKLTGEAHAAALWLPALLPIFLLAFHGGWTGGAVAGVGGFLSLLAATVLSATAEGAAVPVRSLIPGVLFIGSASAGAAFLAYRFRRALEAAHRSALTDPGTGLPNRRHGMLHMRRAFAAAQRGAPLSVVMFDIDRFKEINDRFGHRTGDTVLEVFGTILERHTRTMNLTVRYGGEEFLAILDGAAAEGAAIMAERVLASLREHPFPWGHVTASAGVAQYERGMASPEVLVAAADQALYRAKATGRDRVETLAAGDGGPDSVLRPLAPVSSFHGNNERVLVVDDDPGVARALAEVLRHRHYRPIQADDPEGALEIIERMGEPLDLVVTDVAMPRMSGFRLVEILLQRQPELRALYISGSSREEIQWHGAPGSLKAFLPKPIEVDTLAAAVRRILDAPIPRASRDSPGDEWLPAAGQEAR